MGGGERLVLGPGGEEGDQAARRTDAQRVVQVRRGALHARKINK
jgi:hypothetical protein